MLLVQLLIIGFMVRGDICFNCMKSKHLIRSAQGVGGGVTRVIFLIAHFVSVILDCMGEAEGI